MDVVSEPVSINGIPVPYEDVQTIIKELDSRRRTYHANARSAKTLGTQQAEARKAEHLDSLIKFLSYVAGAEDPSDVRISKRRSQEIRAADYRRHYHRELRARARSKP